MIPTRLGAGALVMLALTTISALSTGNNLLYLLFGVVAGALVVSLAVARWNTRGLEVVVEGPPQAFRSTNVPLRVLVRNTNARTAWLVEVRAAGGNVFFWRVPPRATAEGVARAVLPYRGLNDLGEAVVSSVFPFYLLRAARRVKVAPILALPQTREMRAPSEARASSEAYGRQTLRKGSGEELYGLREFGPGDDARAINWKVSARGVKVMVNEYATSHDSKVLVRAVDGGDDAVEEAAALCRHHIDAGSEVSLELPDRRVGFGKGLLHLDLLLREAALSGAGSTPRAAAFVQAPAVVPRLDDAGRRLTLAGAYFVYAGMFLIDEIRPALLAACSPMLLLALFVQLKRRPVLPALIWSLLSAGMLVFTVFYDWRASGVAVANVHLLLYLLANRVLTPFEEKEAGQLFLILYLAFFLISGLTISLWYFAAILIWSAFAAAWLTLAAGAPASEWRAWSRPVAAAALCAGAVAAVLFAVTPRVEGLRRLNPFVSAGVDKLGVKSSSVMGFTENVSLGFFGELKKSSARVLRVKPPAGLPRPPAVYVRGSAFDAFDGHRWSKSLERIALAGKGAAPADTRIFARRQGDQLVFPSVAPARADAAYDIQIYPMMLSVLFTVGTPWVVEGRDDLAWFDHTDSVRVATSYLTGARYRVRASPVGGFGRALAGYDGLLRRRFLATPPDPDGRRAALVRKVVGASAEPEAAVEALANYLRRSHAYSTYSDGKDRTVDDFLFKSKRGNCEYFASAAVVLFRHAGVPARLVSGFLAEDWNQYGLFFDVRQSDAHAWAEVWLPQRGWVTVDATPSVGALGLTADAFGRRLEKWFDAAQTEWYRRVIGYDLSVQRDTFRRLGEAASLEAVESVARALAGVGGGLGALYALWTAGLWWWRKRGAPKLSAYQKVEALLARAGVPRRPDLTPREYARLVIAQRPELEALGALAEVEYRRRYGGFPEDTRAQRLMAELSSRL